MLLLICPTQSGCQSKSASTSTALVSEESAMLPAANLFDRYSDKLADKKVGVIANQTSLVGETHLVDFLLSKGIKVQRVFAPEHGFRGEAGPGDKVASGKDEKTGLPLVSLYGSHRKPEPKDLEGLDIIVFDIQDVGARFYTYISTLQLVMEACAEAGIPVMVLDRPNPNGFYVDGPVLDTAFSSFVGISPIPIVHGLTMGEYAKMANGEGWMKNGVKCKLEVIAMEGYHHNMEYILPVRPSPNLPDMASIYLYPSLCLFEGTVVSVGRGTPFPFRLIGYPGFKNGNENFTPIEIAGVIKDPPHEGVPCKGIKLDTDWKSISANQVIELSYLIDMYNSYPEKEKFFNNFFEKLAGNDQLKKQIISGMKEAEIRKTWEPSLENYKLKRKKYLLYDI